MAHCYGTLHYFYSCTRTLVMYIELTMALIRQSPGQFPYAKCHQEPS